MKISVIGTGYVGLVTGTCFAELGNEVLSADINEQKIKILKEGGVPIYEPGLSELIERNIKESRLAFTTDVGAAVKFGEVVFIAVGTPAKEDGSADLTYVNEVAHSIAKNLDRYKVIVNKSTVPVGTGDIVTRIIREKYTGEFDVVSNPEFLREGSAVNDCLNPDRVVIGNGNDRARKVMTALYKTLECPILFTDVKSAELIKYASNSLLACEISFINNLATLAEKVGADIEMVSQGMRLDKRIGKQAFLGAGAGYGGSCFPKDVQALTKILNDFDTDASLLTAVERINRHQKMSVVNKLKRAVPNLKDKKIAVWGLAFKPKTDDLREAVSLTVIPAILELGAKISAFDPVAQKEAEKIFKGDIQYAENPLTAIQNADALVILTEWDEFRQIDKNEIKELLSQPIVIDGRNVFNPKEMEELGFKYLSVGRL